MLMTLNFVSLVPYIELKIRTYFRFPIAIKFKVNKIKIRSPFNIFFPSLLHLTNGTTTHSNSSLLSNTVGSAIRYISFISRPISFYPKWLSCRPGLLQLFSATNLASQPLQSTHHLTENQTFLQCKSDCITLFKKTKTNKRTNKTPY